MSEKRRDSKNRILLKGESQKKDGRYEYKYVDSDGKRRTLTSWRLVKTDKVPIGKREKGKLSLREQEAQVRRDLDDGINTYAVKTVTLNQAFDTYIETKKDLDESTRVNYKYMYNRFVRDGLGQKKIVDIKYSDIKRFYTNLIDEKSLAVNTLDNIQTVLHPVFRIAVRDGYIRWNPTDDVMKEIKKGFKEPKKKRHALTERQQEIFIEYVKSSKIYSRWLFVITVLLGTGCRIGEATSLRWEDCNFDKKEIYVSHSLRYRTREKTNKAEFFMKDGTKTVAGIRIIPMMEDLRKVLLEEYNRQRIEGFNTTIIDGYTNFIFKNRDGGVLSAASVQKAFVRIRDSYNKMEMELAQKEGREPELLPDCSPHCLRHTFCVHLCRNIKDVKVIQEIMGHEDIVTTFQIYNEVIGDIAAKSISQLDGVYRIC